MLKSEVIEIEPEVLQFTREDSHILKIINKTSQPLHNFFFCLYNTQKFAFSPVSFSLAPNEHKLITVTMKIKSSKAVVKEFAYLKSAEVNKRLTILINNFQSPESKGNSDGAEEMNTLSSREYGKLQQRAYEKIVEGKDLYMAKFDRDQQGITFRTEESHEKKIYMRQKEDVELKIDILDNENSKLIEENMYLRTKVEELAVMSSAGEIEDKDMKIRRLTEETSFLEEQGNQFLRKLQEREDKIGELEKLNKKVMEQVKKDNQAKVTLMEEKLQTQRKSYQDALALYENKIKNLEVMVDQHDFSSEKENHYKGVIEDQQEQIDSFYGQLEQKEKLIENNQNLQNEKLKLELSYSMLKQSSAEKQSKITELEKINQKLHQQLRIEKDKSQTSKNSIGEYKEIAYQTYKNENQKLIKELKEMQTNFEEVIMSNRSNEDIINKLESQVEQYRNEVQYLAEIKENLEQKSEDLSQQNHLMVMQLKTENISLMEKIAQTSTNIKEEEFTAIRSALKAKEIQIEDLTKDLRKAKNSINDFEDENYKLSEKVKKYKKEAKRELKTINETAVEQLKRVHEEKKLLSRKVAELQQEGDNDKTRHKSRTRYEDFPPRGQVRASTNDKIYQQSENEVEKKVGIKDQRKELQESGVRTNKPSNIDLEGLYNELAELREINSYLKSEEERINRLFDLDDSDGNEGKAIFRLIKFFKKLENRMRDLQGEANNSMAMIKQTQFLKGRLTEIESQKKAVVSEVNVSQIQLNKQTYQSDLLQVVRQEMKTQYKKMYEALKLSEQKYELLKKKIYQEYRLKIVQLLNKQDRHAVSKIEILLERFIDSMSNLSHKEAVLHKEVKLKQGARKQAANLKEKNHQLVHVLQNKKGYCTRQPVKVFFEGNQAEWQHSIKIEAQYITLEAQNTNLSHELALLNEQLEDYREKINNSFAIVEQREDTIAQLKRNQIQLQHQYEKQIEKQNTLIEQNKSKMLAAGKESKGVKRKGKDSFAIQQELDRKTDIIRSYKEKCQRLEEQLENAQKLAEKDKDKEYDKRRLETSNKDLLSANKDLRFENRQLAEEISKLGSQLEAKKTTINNIKAHQKEEGRIRQVTSEEQTIDKLREQIIALKNQLKKEQFNYDKYKKKKEKEVNELRNQYQRSQNEALILQKSLESVIRALVDSIRKLYDSLKIIIKKRGTEVRDFGYLFEHKSDLCEINAVEIDKMFERLLLEMENDR